MYAGQVVTVRQSKTLHVYPPDSRTHDGHARHYLRVELATEGMQVYTRGKLALHYAVDLTCADTTTVLAFLDAAGLRTPTGVASLDSINPAVVREEVALAELAVEQLREVGTDEDLRVAGYIEANLPAMRAYLECP